MTEPTSSAPPTTRTAQRVVVTGAGGLVGRRVVTMLLASDAVGHVVALDVDTSRLTPRPNMTVRTVDVLTDDLDEVFAGADTVVHLAFLLDPIHDEDHMRRVNVEGTQQVFEAADRAGVDTVVYLSSATVYGGHRDNPVPMDESAPVRPNDEFSYARHKGEIERWLADWLEGRDLTATILRPSLIAGPGVENVFSRALEAPRFLRVVGHEPPMQFVHVEDVASAIVLAVEEHLPGVYNCASEGWLSFDEILGITGIKTVDMGVEVAFATVERLWRTKLAEYPPGALHYWMAPWVVTSRKLIDAGWRPKHSNRDALAELVAEHSDHVAFAGVRVRRDLLTAAGVAGGAAAVTGLGLLARSLLRRRGGGAA